MTENFQEGCILISRSLMDSSVFQNEKWLKVWIWCLLKANHKKKNVPITTGKGQTVVTIDRGQFIFGRHIAAKELKLNSSTVRNIMEKLEKLENLDMQKTSHYSIVTIRNYGVYQNIENYKGQAKGQPKDNQRTTKGQPKDTTKNVKNDNNEKNNKEDILVPEDIIEAWNDICGTEGFGKIVKLTADRRKKINDRLKAHPEIKFWADVLNKMIKIPFLKGSNDRNWKANIDWLMANDTNAVKILEGYYENTKNR